MRAASADERGAVRCGRHAWPLGAVRRTVLVALGALVMLGCSEDVAGPDSGSPSGSIVLQVETDTLWTYQKAGLSVRVQWENGAPRSGAGVTLTTTDRNVLRVSGGGPACPGCWWVTATAPGTAAIVARALDLTASVTVHVREEIPLLYEHVHSRFVLLEPGTFELQHLDLDGEIINVNTGSYTIGADRRYAFAFDWDPRWTAIGTLRGDSLFVEFSRDMIFNEFENAAYVRRAPPHTVSGPAGVYLANADGSAPRMLATGNRPAWSPDGRRIAFDRGGRIHVVDVEGSNETALTAGVEPAWSPDGARIAFADDEGISVMSVDGSGVTRLLHYDFVAGLVDAWRIGKPAWSPDGLRIAFEHFGDGDVTPAQIYVMNADGSAPHRLTPLNGGQYAESDPEWSPDGSRIVFWSYGYGIATVAAGGGTPRTLYRNFPFVHYGANPDWSPDGATIVFAANRFAEGEEPSLHALGRSGGAPRRLVSDAHDPAWSPDGATLAFAHGESDE